MRLRPIIFALLVSLPALAESPWGDADPRHGAALHAKSCVDCHARLLGGDGGEMYTRDPRLVNNAQELLRRVVTCSTQVRAGWFPEDEAAVAAWLNDRYYRFAR